jgi:uncharacterized membrane protein
MYNARILEEKKHKIMNNEDQQIKHVPDGSFSQSFGFGWEQIKKYFLYLFLATIIGAVAETPVGVVRDISQNITPGWTFLWILSFLYGLLLLPVIIYGIDLFFLQAIRDEPLDFKKIFTGFNNYVNIILAHLLATALIILGFIFFIIPGFILACRLVFVPYLVMDRQLDPIKAVEKSWQMTYGHGWKIFGMGVVSFFLIIFGLILMFVGVLFSAMWISATFASLYYSIDEKEKSELEA